ncbi:hypothetical protein QTP81_07235 [Alteromonas sp. ASW11-36]|uniref:STAS/SEC14 domain-containing protein n=1 Tax=Alteromonas arenosi TaxID=3055817 RepID=A0ABT7SW64_9ALTE|nr:hypothetical protein [Alteromonas sp. ASW11-36]MDM7860385.1 hypothetical protein [Alteromonas sp. ASW11-36]
MSFASHGELELWVKDNIVFMEISGGWNLEKAKEFTHRLNTEILPLIKAPYAAIGILHDDWMPTADAVPHLNRATLYAIKAGMVKEAYVSSSALSSRVTQSLVLPADCQHYQSREFDTLEEAINWVKESLERDSVTSEGRKLIGTSNT